MRFLNRRHAGHLLAQKLARYRHEPSGIVIALPRGGVAVGHEVAAMLGLPVDVLESLYRGDKPPVDVHGRTVILVDDGLATDSAMRASLAMLRQQEPKRIVIAVPVGAPDVCETLQALADDFVSVAMPSPLRAVSIWYDSFEQVSDDEVRRLLAAADRPSHAPADAPVSAWM